MSAVKGLVTYQLEWLNPRGELQRREEASNITPLEGRNFVLNTAFGKGQQAGGFYIGLFEGDYTPTDATKAQTFVAEAVECTAYTQATRLPFHAEESTTGVLSNLAQQAEFVFNAPKTVRGAFISTAQAKGASSGALLSVVRFAAPQDVTDGSTLRVRAGFSLTNT